MRASNPRTLPARVIAFRGCSARGVESSGESDVKLLVPHRPLARLSRLAFCVAIYYASVLCIRTQVLFTARLNRIQ